MDRIDQSLYFVEKGNKKFLLPWLIKNLNPPVGNALVFSRTKHGADKIAKDLNKQGIPAAAIHGNKSQSALSLIHIYNAIKFTPAGGTIRFSVEKLGPEVEISIWNSGQGISPEALPYVFQRFYKEDRSRGLHARGAGLGLDVYKRQTSRSERISS